MSEDAYDGMLDADLIQDSSATEFRLYDNAKRARIAVGVMIAVLVVQLLSLWSEWLQVELLTEFDNLFNVDDDILARAESNDRRQLLIQVLTFGVMIGFIVVFLNWFRRAYGNLHRLQVPRLMVSEVHAVWAWFIPIISLFRPVQIATEIWKHTGAQLEHFGGRDTTKSQRALLLGFWWFCWIGGGVVSRVAAFKVRGDAEIAEMITSTQMVMVAEVFRFTAGVLLMLTILKISGLETELARKVRESGGQVIRVG